ncbi:MAG TPA: VCBS repeat-containing protein [Gammaproteobacteria bacterium]|nr:VCBS repeat-containing protein [Gammaproteobacteria bacterium]
MKRLNAVLLALLAALAVACSKDSGLSGEQLAAQYCSTCHLEPVSGQLPRESWPFVLRWMGNYLGFKDFDDELGEGIVDRDIMPDKKLISSGDFGKIRDYFLAGAKSQQEIFASDRREYEPTAAFSAAYPIRDVAKGEFVTLVRFDPFSDFTFVGFGTENNKRLEFYDRQFRKVADFKMKSEPVHLVPFSGGFRLSLIGDFLYDKGEGVVYEVRPSNEKGKLDVWPMVHGYNRLTQSLSADFNGDGHNDLLLVGFGQGHIGRTSIIHRLKDGSYGAEKILFSGAGSLCAEVQDFDGNGQPDIMLLIAQERQELALFLNQGGGNFERRLLHKEAAGFGYNHFTLADMNGDGKLDVITSNGNNMEIPDAPLKPQHGIRILLNQGNLEWREAYFFPLHGAIKSIAQDFDKDGDVDIAAIAFYPDWDRETPTTFVYLRNDGGLKFTPSTLPREHWGRWMVMDSGDVNGDGYQDLILGAAYIDKGIAPRYAERYQVLKQESPSLLFLYNKGGQH